MPATTQAANTPDRRARLLGKAKLENIVLSLKVIRDDSGGRLTA
jgi:hypothetical protein